MRDHPSAAPSVPRRIPRATVILALEILAVTGWTGFIGMDYLDFNPHLWPDGTELIANAQSHAMWVALRRCGLCFLWNGSVNGGAPSFVEVLGAPLHPFVMLSTLLFGFINGIKATLLLSLALAGFAQIWMGRILRLHPIVRLWCAGIAVAGGHLSGRMEDGLVQIVLSTAACSLVIPALLQFLLSASRKNVVLLSLVLASAILAGQGYMQIGFALSILPGFVVLGFLFQSPKRFPWRKLLFAGVLALLLTAFFLVPLAHFLPLFSKHTDPFFTTAQPLQYLPLNLVISDTVYYNSSALEKLEFLPYIYSNYIGWLPVLLALFACTTQDVRTRKFLLLFLGSTVMVFLAASAWTFRLAGIIDRNLAGSIRYPALIAGLAPPLILSMAGVGLQAALFHPWPTFLLRLRKAKRWHLRIPIRAAMLLLLAAAMALSLQTTAGFSLRFLVSQPAFSIPEGVFQAIDSDEVELVQTPFLEYGWFPQMLEHNFKIPQYLRAWDLSTPEVPSPRFLILPHSVEPESNAGWTMIREAVNYRIYVNAEHHFAVLHAADGDLPCTAHGMGGNLDVTCQSDTGGVLEVKENAYDGWQVTLDGQNAQIVESQWLSVRMPAGSHTASFRFRPWDVPVGFVLSVFGGVLAVAYLRRRESDSGSGSIGKEVPLTPPADQPAV